MKGLYLTERAEVTEVKKIRYLFSVRYNLSLSDKKPSESVRMPVAKSQYFNSAGFNLHHSPTVNREPLNLEPE